MKKLTKTMNKKSEDAVLMPFDEALKRVWSAPPAPMVKPKKKTTKKK